MDFPSLGTNRELDDIMQRARKYDIEENLLDLVMYGFTVVPPEKLAPPELTKRLRTAILQVYERRSGKQIGDWQTHEGKLGRFQSWGWMLEDDAFLEAIHNPVFQTIGQFLTGQSGFIAGAAVILKTRQQEFDLPLHSDSHGVPPPWPSFATYANLSWLLTDYLCTEDGPTLLVPGSSPGPNAPPGRVSGSRQQCSRWRQRQGGCEVPRAQRRARSVAPLPDGPGRSIGPPGERGGLPHDGRRRQYLRMTPVPGVATTASPQLRAKAASWVRAASTNTIANGVA